MTGEQLDTATDQLTVTTEVQCEHCDYQWGTESEMPRVTCPSCQRKTDRNVVRKTATIPTRHIGDKESIEAVADLFEERASLARELYERGWSTNVGIDGPNFVQAIPGSETEDANGDESASDRPPITDEQWEGDTPSDDPSTGVGVVDFVCECPFCEEEIIVQHDDWNLDGKIVSEDEVFCYNCEMAVEKQLTGVRFTDYPKERFRHTPDLRTAALKLKGLSEWLRGLDQSGWYLDNVRDEYLHLRYDVDDVDDVELDSRGSLEEIATE